MHHQQQRSSRLDIKFNQSGERSNGARPFAAAPRGTERDGLARTAETALREREEKNPRESGRERTPTLLCNLRVPDLENPRFGGGKGEGEAEEGKERERETGRDGETGEVRERRREGRGKGEKEEGKERVEERGREERKV